MNVHAPSTLSLDDVRYPDLHVLGEAPEQLAYLGDLSLLERPLLAVFCSVKCPASLILEAQDAAKALRGSAVNVMSGFHSPVEKEMLTVLLGGSQPIVMVAARGLDGMRVKREYKSALEDGKLLIVSPFDGKHKRATAKMALYRNQVVAALADTVLFVHAAAGGKTKQLAKEVVAWGKPCFALESRHNEHLLTAGLESVGLEDIATVLRQT